MLYINYGMTEGLFLNDLIIPLCLTKENFDISLLQYIVLLYKSETTCNRSCEENAVFFDLLIIILGFS